VIEVNRKILLFEISFIAILLVGNVYMALATTVYTEYESAGAACVIDVPDKPLIRLVAYGQMYGDYYSGNNHADRIQILVWTGTGWRYVAGYEDNPTRSEFSDGLGLGTFEYVVKPGQIQVLRDQENNINMVHWNIPLECPATDTTPAVTLPPGKLVLQGFGELKTSGPYSNLPIGTTGWTYSVVGHYYSATASFFCEDWDCKWVTVGEGRTDTRVFVDRTWTWMHE
jgi:hypothetical protein